ncbi:MAG: hypothetical protein ACREYC_12900, partial [Gammaproteobacteria bacterium]
CPVKKSAICRFSRVETMPEVKIPVRLAAASLSSACCVHENYLLQLYAIHAGDALVKTLLMCVILGVWRKASFFGQAGSASRGAE